MKIYTKTGDDGYTTLGSQRLPKNDLYFQFLGSVDMVNSFIGLLLTEIPKSNSIYNYLLKVQENMMLLSSYISGYLDESDVEFLAGELNNLEIFIDNIESSNTPLKNFILPGGTKQSSIMHILRSHVRQAERDLISLIKAKDLKVSTTVVSYLNRMSDMFFVLARYFNNQGKDDIIWKM